jgi:hypothetical protein
MEQVGDIPTKSFSKSELNQRYELTRFIEGGEPFCVLVPQDPENRINTGGMWKFGVVKSRNPKEIDWFYNGQVRTRNRKEARQIYTLLQHYCQLKNLGEAFAFKVRLKNPKN